LSANNRKRQCQLDALPNFRGHSVVKPTRSDKITGGGAKWHYKICAATGMSFSLHMAFKIPLFVIYLFIYLFI